MFVRFTVDMAGVETNIVIMRVDPSLATPQQVRTNSHHEGGSLPGHTPTGLPLPVVIMRVDHSLATPQQVCLFQ